MTTTMSSSGTSLVSPHLSDYDYYYGQPHLSSQQSPQGVLRGWLGLGLGLGLGIGLGLGFGLGVGLGLGRQRQPRRASAVGSAPMAGRGYARQRWQGIQAHATPRGMGSGQCWLRAAAPPRRLGLGLG